MPCWGMVRPHACSPLPGHPGQGEPLVHSRHGVFSVGTEAPAGAWAAACRGLAAVLGGGGGGRHLTARQQSN